MQLGEFVAQGAINAAIGKGRSFEVALVLPLRVQLAVNRLDGKLLDRRLVLFTDADDKHVQSLFGIGIETGHRERQFIGSRGDSTELQGDRILPLIEQDPGAELIFAGLRTGRRRLILHRTILDWEQGGLGLGKTIDEDLDSGLLVALLDFGIGPVDPPNDPDAGVGHGGLGESSLVRADSDCNPSMVNRMGGWIRLTSNFTLVSPSGLLVTSSKELTPSLSWARVVPFESVRPSSSRPAVVNASTSIVFQLDSEVRCRSSVFASGLLDRIAIGIGSSARAVVSGVSGVSRIGGAGGSRRV